MSIKYATDIMPLDGNPNSYFYLSTIGNTNIAGANIFELDLALL